MTKDTGGPAFPLHNHGTQTLGMHLSGMTLRDYFAAKAMQAFCSTLTGITDSDMPKWGVLAGDAYQMADAMLKARQE